MIVVRLFVLLGLLGFVSLAAGCPSPLPELEDGGSDSSGGTEESSGSNGAEVDTTVDDTGADPVCGNGIVEAGESCDDGLETATCNANCTLVGCGDGIVNVAVGEQCDAAGETALCDDDCTPVSCGDGVVNEAAGEECEGDELAGGTCEGLGFEVGTLACEAGCRYDVSECYVLPAAPVLELGFSQVKRFDFRWAAVAHAEYYQLLESPSPGEPYTQLGQDVVGDSVSFEMPLHGRFEASYVLRACNGGGCSDSAVVDVVGSLVEAVGYVKASNTGAGDQFGYSVALSEDGNTLAVGAPDEDSSATGIGGNQATNSSLDSGAVYVFTRDGLGTWSQQAYLKASNTGTGDEFGQAVALSADGNTLAVGAYLEDSSATGIGGDPADNSSNDSGAVYVFARNRMGTWSQQAYVKASNPGMSDQFGLSVAVSGDGNTLAVGARLEDSSATGPYGNQANESSPDSGAVYVFVRDGLGQWSQQVYVKASNTGANDFFGQRVAVSGDGNTLAVGARLEDSSATGIGGNQADESFGNSGAVYVFARNGVGTWSQQAYVKASNTGSNDDFGRSLALSGDGHTLAVSAYLEDGSATGIDGDQASNSSLDSGAVYVFARDGVGTWSQQAYVKASNTDPNERFGAGVALSGDGNTLAVGAFMEDSSATGIGGDQADDSSAGSGAVYVLARDGVGTWSHQAYVKASNTDPDDRFGSSVALSGDGHTLAVGVVREDSSATGIGGDQADDSSAESGAVYLY